MGMKIDTGKQMEDLSLATKILFVRYDTLDLS